MTTSSSDHERRAQALFKKEVQARQDQEAMSAYQAEQQATLDKTARLRAQRLAHAAEEPDAQPTKKIAKRSGSRRSRRGLHIGARS
jgi:hypothetical protein